MTFFAGICGLILCLAPAFAGGAHLGDKLPETLPRPHKKEITSSPIAYKEAWRIFWFAARAPKPKQDMPSMWKWVAYANSKEDRYDAVGLQADSGIGWIKIELKRPGFWYSGQEVSVYGLPGTWDEDGISAAARSRSLTFTAHDLYGNERRAHYCRILKKDGSLLCLVQSPSNGSYFLGFSPWP